MSMIRLHAADFVAVVVKVARWTNHLWSGELESNNFRTSSLEGLRSATSWISRRKLSIANFLACV